MTDTVFLDEQAAPTSRPFVHEVPTADTRSGDRRKAERPWRAALRERVETVRRYSGDEDRPLRGYAALTGAYLGASALLLARVGRLPDARVSTGDLVRIGVASHRLSRTITKETIASPLRAPFTKYAGQGVGSELTEEVVIDGAERPHAHAFGELLTCPFCMAQWTSTALVAAHLLAPKQARVVTAVLDAATIANVLHLLYSGLAEKIES